MNSLPVEESSSRTDLRLRIKYYRTTIVLNILHIYMYYNKSYALISSSCVFGTPCNNKVQVGKDQEKAQSEKDSHSKNRGGEKPN